MLGHREKGRAMSDPLRQEAPCGSYRSDIRPKFTDEDVEHMRDQDMDLDDYETVKANAEIILARLQDSRRPMPPRPRGPWPPEWIACFQQWIDNGKLP
jgi:hypothetical protein